MLTIKNLHAEIDKKKILNGISLNIKPGEIHAIMGPNGSGKSTLSKAITGHPDCHITKGTLEFESANLIHMPPETRAQMGIFLSFQYPVELPGVKTREFLRMILNQKRESRKQDALDPMEFDDYVKAKLSLLEMDPAFLDRALNQGFSGGEKKRNEILQMALLEPKLAILDEIDSGLDIDALQTVATAINKIKAPETSVILITHYQRLLNYITPDFVHVIYKGKIIESGDKAFALKLETKGYDWVIEKKA